MLCGGKGRRQALACVLPEAVINSESRRLNDPQPYLPPWLGDIIASLRAMTEGHFKSREKETKESRILKVANIKSGGEREDIKR